MTFVARRACVASLFVLLFSSVASAADHYVAVWGRPDATGAPTDPWSTIQGALDQAGPGDRVIIRSGVFHERLRFPTGGLPGAPITVRADAGQRVVVDGSSFHDLGSTDAVVEIDDASHIRFLGIEVRNSRRTCVRVLDGTHVELAELRISNCRESGIAFFDSDVPMYATVRDNVVHDVGQAGILLWKNNGGYFLVENNEVYNVGGEGNHDGIQANDTPWVVIRGNVVHDVNPAGDFIDVGGNQYLEGMTHHVLVENNVVYPGAGLPDGRVKLNNQPRRAIYRKNVLSGTGFAFYEQPFHQVAIYHNTIVNAVGHSVIFWTLDASGPFAGIQVKNNIFAYADDKLLMHSPKPVDGGLTSILMSGNAYGFGPGGGVEWAVEGANHDFEGTAAGYQQWRAVTGQEPFGGTLLNMGLGGVFVNPGSGDYSPRRGGPLVDRGVPLTNTTAAGSGTQVPVGAAYFFFDGFGMTEGDFIRVGSQITQVLHADDASRILTVSPAVSWTQGAPVSLAYAGGGPDIGAVETMLDEPGSVNVETPEPCSGCSTTPVSVELRRQALSNFR